ncbi:uncharacterized protein AB675_7793 [Cyphellophora attinorum]|uniref:Uncharacterized protein n=1 Tax=Cyphellophora attinorum TaxID=1664694 RepID=A0A0N1H4Q1_9EURO|nr:uncharacterized protein AB675_7793 [Phialophora attinorum]KPI40326.1 hypothetical protein AB675_7793 [Phialophora attinorum]
MADQNHYYQHSQQRSWPGQHTYRPAPQAPYNPNWQQVVNDQLAHNQALPEPDRDSAYWSRSSGPDWKDRLEVEAAKTEIHDLKASIVTLEQQLKNVQELRDEDAKDNAREIDRLGISLGTELMRNGSWAPALRELNTVMGTRRGTLQAKMDENPPNTPAIKDAQTKVHEIELATAKALSNLDRDREAIALLQTIEAEGHKEDPSSTQPMTRDAQSQLCMLLERSPNSKHHDEALAILNWALCNAEDNPDAVRLPWIAGNMSKRARLLLKKQKYADAILDAHKAWQLKLKREATTDIRKVIQHDRDAIVTELQQLGQHKFAFRLVAKTTAADFMVSRAGISSLAKLGRSELFDTYDKCLTLNASQRRDLGWEVARDLRDMGEYSSAADILGRLPTAAKPSQDHVDDLRSQLLMKLSGYDDHKKAAELAAPLVEQCGFATLPGKDEVWHVWTLLSAIERMSKAAQDRPNSAEVFRTLAQSYWQPLYQKAKEEHLQVPAPAGMRKKTLEDMADIGSNLRLRWTKFGQPKPASSTSGNAERAALSSLRHAVAEVEGWAGKTRKKEK